MLIYVYRNYETHGNAYVSANPWATPLFVEALIIFPLAVIAFMFFGGVKVLSCWFEKK